MISDAPIQELQQDTLALNWFALPETPTWVRFTWECILHVRNTRPETRYLSYYPAARPDMPHVYTIDASVDLFLGPMNRGTDLLFVDENGNYLQLSGSAPGLIFAVTQPAEAGTSSEDDLQNLLGIIRSYGGFFHTYPDSDEDAKALHAMCGRLEQQGAITRHFEEPGHVVWAANG